MIKSSDSPRRGEIWLAHTGGKRHALLIVSLNERNSSDRVSSVLAIPFGSSGKPGPTSMCLQPGETGLPEASYLKAHFISVVEKSALLERLPRPFSNQRMKQVVAMVNRAIDPDAPYRA